MNRKYQIINNNNEFVTRKDFTSELTFTDNKNFAYIFTIEEAEKVKSLLSKNNNELKIVNWK
jgi:hypothetical protein